MNLPAPLQERKSQILKDVFGFPGFRPGQEEVVDHLLSGRNVLAVMPTGAGKSLCFQLPALAMGGLTVVVSPLIALMHDQVAALRLAGVRAETINSAKDRGANVDAWRRVAAGEADILYLSPERLMTDRMLAALGHLPVSLLVVDEAHCIAQWGPAFRPEYADLARLGDAFPSRPLAAFTATADEVTRREISEKLFRGQAEIFVQGFDRPNIRLTVRQKSDWRRQLKEALSERQGQSGIIYCLSRRKTEEASVFLRALGFDALAYHAGMDKADREANQAAFMTREGVVMVATIAFGMGIDKPDIRFVCHTDLPGSVEAYYQEFGRAARDGGAGEAIMLYGLEDIRVRRMMIEQELGHDKERKRQDLKRLESLLAYCEAPLCRRQTLLNYFGEERAPCGNCDLCLEPVALTDGTTEARSAIEVIQDTGAMFGAHHIVEVLRGADTEKVRKFKHDRLPGYSQGEDISRKNWLAILRQMVAGGFLRLDIEGHGALAISSKGKALLEGNEGFHYRKTRLQTGRPKDRSRAPLPGAALSPPEAALLTELKNLRLEIARDRGIPPYVVFHDRSLEDMARRRPRSLDDFAMIYGVGQSKLDKFADPFLTVIASHQD